MNHDREKKYLEFYAKALLETLFPTEYSEIKMDESPDLRMGENCGIEVTRAMFENQGQADGILNHIKGKDRNIIDQRYLKTMDRLNAKVITRPDGVICGYYDQSIKNKAYFDEILQAYEKKKRLHYLTLQTDLFIYPPLASIDGWLGRTVIEKCFNELSADTSNPFAHVMIYEEPTLYLYEIKKKRMTFRRGTEDEIQACKEAANEYSGWSACDP